MQSGDAALVGSLFSQKRRARLANITDLDISTNSALFTRGERLKNTSYQSVIVKEMTLMKLFRPRPSPLYKVFNGPACGTYPIISYCLHIVLTSYQVGDLVQLLKIHFSTEDDTTIPAHTVARITKINAPTIVSLCLSCCLVMITYICNGRIFPMVSTFSWPHSALKNMNGIHLPPIHWLRDTFLSYNPGSFLHIQLL